MNFIIKSLSYKLTHRFRAILLATTLSLTALTGCSASGRVDSTEHSAASASQTQLEAVTAAGKLVVGVEGTFPPYTYHDESGELTGMDVELGRAVAEKLGVKAEFVEASWDALLIGMDSGRFDTVINSVSITEDRSEKYDFSAPYCYIARHVVTRAEDDSIRSAADLQGKIVATNSTNAFIPWYEAQGATVVAIDTANEGIEMLLSGRADFMGMNTPVLNAYYAEHPEARARLRDAFVIPNSEDVIAIPVRKGESEFQEAINEALAELRADGTLSELSKQYLGGDYTYSETDAENAESKETQ